MGAPLAALCAAASRALQQVQDRVVEGTDIATPMKMSGAFPPTVSYMVGVGEQAGNLEEMLERIAGTYDEGFELPVDGGYW